MLFSFPKVSFFVHSNDNIPYPCPNIGFYILSYDKNDSSSLLKVKFVFILKKKTVIIFFSPAGAAEKRAQAKLNRTNR